MSANKIAIIGLGNTLRRDDGIGIVILESLLALGKKEGIDTSTLLSVNGERSLEVGEGRSRTIEYLNFGIASFDLVHRMECYEKILLIDAIDAGLAAGELKIFELKDIAYNLKSTPTSTHEFDLKSLFELYKRFELKSKIYVAGIQVKDISYGEGLSKPLQEKQEEIVKKIADFINEELS